LCLSDKIIIIRRRKQDNAQLKEGKSRGPLKALKKMVTIPRKLNMDHLKVHLTSESGKKRKEIEQTNSMEPRGDEGSFVVFYVH
jgi:hypothetical protein